MDMVVTRCPGFLAGSAEDETALDGPTQKTGAELVAVVPLSAEEIVWPSSNSAIVLAGGLIVLLVVGSWGKTSLMADGPITILGQIPAQESTSKKSFLE